MRNAVSASLYFIAFFILFSSFLEAQAPGDEVILKRWLVIPMKIKRRTGMLVPSPLASKYLLPWDGSFPSAGRAEPGMAEPWTEVEADDKGEVKHAALRNGYAAAVFESEEDRVLLAEGKGHYTLYVNGDPFTGDIYRRGYGMTPVFFRQGKNLVLVRAVGRGRNVGFTLKFLKPASTLVLLDTDPTRPDLREGKPLDAWGSVLLLNASTEAVDDAFIEAGGRAFETTKSAAGNLPPLGMRKVPFSIVLPGPIDAGDDQKSVDLDLKVVSGKGTHSVKLELRYRRSGDAYMETFISGIDGSVQYYAVRPPRRPPEGKVPLYLSCHGASVEAHGQANAYSSKPRGFVVAATNRRPFGFDWEDWGRLDALEVIEVFSRRYPIDPDRVYLTGHSMGGHGTWHIGVNHPGLFAAIAPSAGWISFWTYAGRPRPKNEGAEAFFARGLGPSDTLSLKENLKDLPVFILHGSIDDNVPVREARKMAEELAKFHKDWVYREIEGKKHWWNDKSAKGTDCVDLPELFDFLDRHRRPRAPHRLHFKTYSPGVSSKHRWLRVLGQEKLLALSEVKAEVKEGDGRIELETKNVSLIALDPSRHFEPGKVVVAADGTEFNVEWKGEGEIFIEKKGDQWSEASGPPDSRLKHAERYGPFKQAFTRNFVMVYGTGGTPEENSAALSRARFDAQVWWYRGNGAAEMIPDTLFGPEKHAERNVVLYGHAGMNKAYDLVLDRSQALVERGRMKVGDKALEGEDLSCLFIRPRKGNDHAMVAVVGGTGPAGIRGTLLASYFRSGIQFPDLTVWGGGPEEGAPEGIRAAGLFGRDWKVASGEWWFSEGWKGPGEPKEEEDF